MTTNTPATQGTSPITTKQVEEEKLFDFLPQMFGKYYMLGESVVYSTMRELCVGYCGGQWLYFDLSNGGHSMGLDSETDFEVIITGNHFQDSLSSDAASIVVNLLVLARIGESVLERGDEDAAKHLFNEHHLLMDFAREHKEAEKIMRAVD